MRVPNSWLAASIHVISALESRNFVNSEFQGRPPFPIGRVNYFSEGKNWKRKIRKNGRRKTTCKLRLGIQVHPIYFIQKACLSLDWSYFGKVQIAVNQSFRQSCSNCVNPLFGCTFFQALCNCWPFLYCQDADQIGKVACLPTIILIAWEKRGGIIPFFAEWRKY